jgi:hypothetical protein
MPPNYPPARTPAWREFLEDNKYLHPYIFAAVVCLVLAIVIGVPILIARIVLGLIQVLFSRRDRDSGHGPRAPPSGNGGG